MQDILSDVSAWIEKEQAIGLATVVNTWGSSPRGVGSRMAMTTDGKITGSVSGGCVEGAVFETAVEVLKTGQPQLLHFGVSDETAWEVGLACGGKIDVFVQPLDRKIFSTIQEHLRNRQNLAAVILLQRPDEALGREVLFSVQGEQVGSLGNELDLLVRDPALNALKEGIPQRATLQDAKGNSFDLFIDVFTTSPTLVMVGGVHTSIALAKFAKILGYRTVLVDPRKAFGNTTRFPHVDLLLQSWPEEAFRQISIDGNTCFAMLTHDPKIDDPALILALNSPAFYIGALGSRTTQDKRRQRLLETGIEQTKLDRIHGPIGADLGGKTPEEIALAIMAEIVAVSHGRNG